MCPFPYLDNMAKHLILLKSPTVALSKDGFAVYKLQTDHHLVRCPTLLLYSHHTLSLLLQMYEKHDFIPESSCNEKQALSDFLLF